VSDYEYDEGEYTPGVDVGSLGREYVDPNAIAQAAAEQVHQAYYPVLQDYEQRVGNMENLTAGLLAGRDMQAEQQLQEHDNQVAGEATRIAAQRLDESYGAGWFRQNGENLRKEIEARPGLLPDAALEGDPRQMADGIEAAARMVYRESVEALRQEQEARNTADMQQMRAALDRESGMRVLKRELNSRR
jgi:hypothetical protein